MELLNEISDTERTLERISGLDLLQSNITVDFNNEGGDSVRKGNRQFSCNGDAIQFYLNKGEKI